MSKIGDIYASVYNGICGVHPKLLPWHFQWLAAKYLYTDLQRILPYFHGTVLDVGCGDKPYQIWLSDHIKHIGIDVYEGKFVDLVIKNDEPWPIETASVEYVICTQVLEHVQDIDGLLDEIYRVLKPSGMVLFTAPFLYHEHGSPEDFRRFSYYGLLSQVSSKYEIMEAGRQGGIGSTIGLLLLSWIEIKSNCSFTLRLFKGVFLPIWIMLSGVVNIVASLMDKLDGTNSF